MLRQILVGLDGSDYSEAALQYALRFAKAFQATLHGLHVVDIVQAETPLLYDLAGSIGAAPYLNLTALMRRNLEFRGQQLLEQFRQACEAEGVACETQLVTGVVPTEIIRAGQTADLVVLGRGGLHLPLSRALLGSAVETVARRRARPTMVTPQQHREIQKPLAATDGSPSSLAALRLGASVAQTLGLDLQVVHCAPTPEAGKPVIQAARPHLESMGVSFHTDVCLGNAHEDLVHYLETNGYDCLFMGAFGHSRVVEWVLGSTTQYLLRTCPAPLVLCHATE